MTDIIQWYDVINLDDNNKLAICAECMAELTDEDILEKIRIELMQVEADIDENLYCEVCEGLIYEAPKI
jgi:hypothetical protein